MSEPTLHSVDYECGCEVAGDVVGKSCPMHGSPVACVWVRHDGQCVRLADLPADVRDRYEGLRHLQWRQAVEQIPGPHPQAGGDLPQRP